MNSLGSSVEADPPLLWSVCCGAYHVGATLTNVAQKISDAIAHPAENVEPDLLNQTMLLLG